MVTQQQKIQRLAKLLSEELERDSWGVVDPFWLKLVAENKDKDSKLKGYNQAIVACEAISVIREKYPKHGSLPCIV